jgi:CheY-like chemotaxis protein
MLSNQGYDVVAAKCGAEALQITRERGPAFDLLLSDVVMPGMNGVELAEKFMETWPTTRILLMSGYTRDVNVVIGAGLPFLRKPFLRAQLLKAVEAALSVPMVAKT